MEDQRVLAANGHLKRPARLQRVQFHHPIAQDVGRVRDALVLKMHRHGLAQAGRSPNLHCRRPLEDHVIGDQIIGLHVRPNGQIQQQYRDKGQTPPVLLRCGIHNRNSDVCGPFLCYYAARAAEFSRRPDRNMPGA